MTTYIVVWLLVGLIAGFLASRVVGGGRGILFDIAVGLLGAVVGGLLLGAAFGYAANGFIGEIVVAFLGALVLLAVLRLVAPPRRRLFR